MALKPLMMRRPEIVSSMMDKITPSFTWLFADVRRRLFPTWAIKIPVTGSKIATKTVNVGLMMTSEIRKTTIVKGSRNIISSDCMIDHSIFITSLVIRDMMSPFRFSLKYESGKIKIRW